MADLERLIEQFKADYEAGRPTDVLAFVDQVPAEKRQELADRLDMYLMDAPRRRWDPAAFEGSLAQAAVDRVHESIEGVSGSWPELLPALRNSARIKRSDLVRRLAFPLGFESEPQVEKIGAYYHQMEHGTLPAGGRVGSGHRRARGGSSTAPPTRSGRRARAAARRSLTRTAFARTAFPDAEFLEQRDRRGPRDVAMDAAPAEAPEARRDRRPLPRRLIVVRRDPSTIASRWRG